MLVKKSCLTIGLFFGAVALSASLWAGEMHLDTRTFYLGGADLLENATLIASSLSPGPNFFRLAFVLKKGDQQVVCVDGHLERPYQAIAKNMPVFSPDGHYYVYLAKDQGQAVLVLNGQQGPPFDGISRPMFSADSSKIVYVAQQGDKQFVVINGQYQPAYAGIALKESPVISPDSKHVAYVALENKKSVLVLDGQKSPAYKLILEPKFSPDSSQLAYIVVWEKEHWQVFKNGQPFGDVYPRISQLTFSPDGQHLAWIVQKGPSGPGQKQFLVLDGQAQKAFDLVLNPIFSPDSRHCAYVAVQDGKMALVKDGQVGRFYSQVGAYMFSPDSRLFLYMAVKGKKSTVIINGQEKGGYDSVGLPVVSPDSAHLAFRVRQGKDWFVVLDGVPGDAYALVRRPWFSPDSKRLAYQVMARDGKWYMAFRSPSGHGSGSEVHDKEELQGPGYALLERPFFSPDSKHVAYVAGKVGQAFVVFDHLQSRDKFTGFLKGVPLVFDSPNTLHGLAMRKKDFISKFYRVQCVLRAGKAHD